MKTYTVVFIPRRNDAIGHVHSTWSDLNLAWNVCELMDDVFFDPNNRGTWIPVENPDGLIKDKDVCGSEDFMKIVDSAESIRADREEDRQIASAISHD